MNAGYTETTGLVSCDDAENLGLIPGSSWICPVGESSLEEIGKHDANDYELTDELLLSHGGRRQNLVRLRFPEGLEAVQIVDTETGEVLTGSRFDRVYFGNFTCEACGYFEVPMPTSAIGGKIRPEISNGKKIVLVENSGGSTLTVIAANPSNGVNKVSINPIKNYLHIRSFGKFPELDGDETQGRFGLHIIEKDSATSCSLEVSVASTRTKYYIGSVTLNLGQSGQLVSMGVDRPKIVTALGISRGDVQADARNEIRLDDTAQQAFVLDAVVAKLGMPKWSGLDLRQTASTMYAQMGGEFPTLTEVLVHQ